MAAAGALFGMFVGLIIAIDVYNIEQDDRINDSTAIMMLAVAQANDIMKRSGLPYKPIVYPKRPKKTKKQAFYTALWFFFGAALIGATIGGLCGVGAVTGILYEQQ